ncbi:UDP-N-acetylmuramyl pentapeptide phosphotransferase/UDP-N-acetylglucosamine-1-phosphate transferase [Aquimarina brevivitae]|uniref:UDP-N-acetylmuramyl pentapeptide phosphotransferase/UDP-N-acetylglucosamine-1-phosphate transferase n=2 Tax=Aquimarina brevivitae TaxID=323412 RepID=A0A4Q7PGN2_9FLAO|nr:UDP-N-acetylmuramyl pentapeptide phosphotransferase/UDP-N-acetylglucosamine-1-phosphate transferase [Aquimarina brevivitae]
MPPYYLLIFFIGAYVLTYLTIPKIIGLVEYKNLMDNPNVRSSHVKKTPTLGGVSFFYTLIFALFFLKILDGSFTEAIYFIPGLTILFIVGLKDDLVVLSPLTKLVAQLAAVSFILSHQSFQIGSLNGFLGIYDIPIFLYYVAGAFIMLTIINAYNLIDGIDGLASIVGIVILVIYTTIFYLTAEYFYVLIALALNGSLIAFLSYNLSSRRKIFMGDTGSLIVGFMISALTLKFLALSPNSYNELPFLLENAPLIAIGILIVPLFDTARVFTIRVANKKSPFSPDRNHTHHILIDSFNLSHQQASFVIGGFNLLFVVLMVILGSTSDNFYLVLFLITTIIILAYIFYRFDYSFSNIKRRILFKRKVDRLKNGVFKKKPNKPKSENVD